MAYQTTVRTTAGRLRTWVLTAIVALLAPLALLAANGAAQAQTTLPPSLQGENFFATDGGPGQHVDLSVVCSAEVGDTFTFTYTADGVASGPYPGTFTETGTVTATVTGFLLGGGSIGVVETWTADFTIDSPTSGVGPTQVTGTKTLKTNIHAACDRMGALTLRQSSASAYLSYTATIRTSTGTFSDQGEAYAFVWEVHCQEGCPTDGFDLFSESFQRSTGVLPLDTSGKATGGGQVIAGSDLFDRVTFGFNVRNTEDDRLHGACNVIDHATGTHVTCKTVTSYQQIGNTATWTGTAKVDGVIEDYRITVQDNGEPNQGLDTFAITTDAYEAAGNVEHGNVQLHQQDDIP